MPRTAPESFEAAYRRAEDPWGFATDPYEQAKYAATIAALDGRRFARGLELGCSIGVLTERLAGCCDALVALDAAPTAVAAARARLAAHPHVEVREAVIPEELPDGPFDLAVCSEVLYYLDADLLDAAVARLVAALEPGGLLVAVHWTGSAASHALDADAVHATLRARTGLRRVRSAHEPGYRLDVLAREPVA